MNNPILSSITSNRSPCPRVSGPACGIVGAALALLLALAPCASAESPFLRNMRTMQDRFARFPKVDAAKPSDVFTLKVEGGLLVLRSRLRNVAMPSSVKLDSLGVGQLTVFWQGAASDDLPTSFNLTLVQLENNQGRQISISHNPNNLSISRQVVTEAGQAFTQINQFGGVMGQPNQFSLQVNGPGADGKNVNINLQAETIEDFRRKHGAEVDRYIRPLLHDLGQDGILSVPVAVAWQVFAADFAPDDAIQKQVKDAVVRLDAEEYQTRQAATDELGKLGAAAAVVLLRLPRESLSVEQLSRIDALLAPYKTLAAADAAKRRKDVGFLVDCLTCEDEQARTLALKQLSAVVGHEVKFDVKASGADLQTAAGKLRQELIPGGKSK